MTEKVYVRANRNNEGDVFILTAGGFQDFFFPPKDDVIEASRVAIAPEPIKVGDTIISKKDTGRRAEVMAIGPDGVWFVKFGCMSNMIRMSSQPDYVRAT